MEGDHYRAAVHRHGKRHFYPRPPGGGRPPKSAKRMKRWYTFLSTPSGWRATTICAVRSAREANFYPRPPGGGRPNRTKPQLTHLLISIHALRVEGDLNKSVAASSQSISIHALRVEGDLYGGAQIVATDRISIHALRVEGDPATERKKTAAFDFYPRPPGGGRLAKHLSFASGASFLSTPSGWRATKSCYLHQTQKPHISIHALRVEGDRGRCASTTDSPKFLSTPSGWRATGLQGRQGREVEFLSTPSGWRATLGGVLNGFFALVFLSTPSGWRATARTTRATLGRR